MEIVIPAAPAGVMTLLALFAPYAIALVNHPAWPTGMKSLISVAVSIVLGLIASILYFAITRDTIPEWPMLIIWFVVVAQASYALVLKGTASKVEGKYGLRE